MTPSLAFVFPGQGSQSLGMLAELAAAHPLVRDAFAEASDGAGLDLWALAQQGPEEDLNRTELTAWANTPRWSRPACSGSPTARGSCASADG